MNTKRDKNDLYFQSSLWVLGFTSISFMVPAALFLNGKLFILGLLFSLGIPSVINLIKLDKKIKNISLVLIFISAILIGIALHLDLDAKMKLIIFVCMGIIAWVLYCFYYVLGRYYE